MKDRKFAFLFYPGEYLRDTQCLSESVQVSYDRIMCEHMRNICITHEQLMFFTKRLTEDERGELLMVLSKSDCGYQIPWVAESIVKYAEYCNSRKKNRDSTPPKKKSTYVEHMVSVNEDVSVKEKKEKKEKSYQRPDVAELIGYLNELNGTRFRVDTKETNKLIVQRIEGGYPVEELRDIIEYKVAEWKGTDKEKWLQPDTLFAADNCAKYRNQVQAAKDKKMSITQIRARPNGPKSRDEMMEEFRIAQAKKYAQV